MTTTSFILRHITAKGIFDYPLRQRLFLIGSADDNDLVLSDRSVPAVLAKFEPDNNGYHCTTIPKRALCIKGKKSSAATLKSGDIFAIGNEHFILHLAHTAQSSTIQSDDTLLEKLSLFIAKVGTEHRLPRLLHLLVTILLDVTNGTDIFLFKLDSEGKPKIFESNKSGDDGKELFSDTIIQKVIQQKKGMYLVNALANPAFRNVQSIADLKLQSVLCTPMLIAGRCVGCIYIGSTRAAVSFTQKDLDTVTLYASIAGTLINHIDYISEQQTTIDRFTENVTDNGIIATSAPMQKVLTAVQAIASADITVLLEGETGTGKNRIAELIHSRSQRSSKPFIIVNCSALHGELLESELFGHKKGSFTGAVNDHEGLFAAAQGGTVFLDEIGELELSLQAKLLRTLETGMIRPIGATHEIPVNVRVLCATNRNLTIMVQENLFRSDLYYRIHQFPISIPPLRQRGEDIELLAHLFLNRYKTDYPEKEILAFHPEALHFIRTHSWSGNIRELSNTIHRSVLMADDRLIRFDQPDIIKQPATDFETATRQFQKNLLQKAILAADGNKEAAAKNIGLSRSTFYRYLNLLDVQ